MEIENTSGLRACRSCCVEKPIDEFRKHNTREWWDTKCRKCWNARALSRNRAKPEHRAEILRKYSAANRDRIAESKRKYTAANLEKRKESCSKWLDANPDARKETCRKWLKKNPLKSRAYNANRRARILNAKGSHTKQDILEILERQDGKCASPICARDIRGYFEVDHVMPLYLNGGNGPDNLQLLCRPCNRNKWKKHPDEWRREVGLITESKLLNANQKQAQVYRESA